MLTIRNATLAVAALALLAIPRPAARAADKPPSISAFSKPAAGSMQILFHGTGGPFMLQRKSALDATQWEDVPNAIVTEVQPGVLTGLIPAPEANVDLSFYRVVSEGDPTTEVNAWTVLLRASSPANGQYFVKGEAPVVTVTILDTMGQGVSRSDFSTLNLYMYGPQDPLQTVTTAKLLNATTDRTKSPHHYIDLIKNGDVQVAGNVLTYKLQPITDEAPGTYTISLWSVLASDGTQQMMKFANVQIGTKDVETPIVAKRASDGTGKCSSCHEGPVSGKLYLHHIDPGHSPTGNWSLDFEPVASCKSCHNNNGYAAYTDPSGAKVSDPIVRRVHGVHMGADLKLPANTNPVNGDFKVPIDYTEVEFPADVRDCTRCHLDDRWKTSPSRLACGSCHDDVWFGTKSTMPAGMIAHPGGAVSNDSSCTLCHLADGEGSIAEAHHIQKPLAPLVQGDNITNHIDQVDVTMTAPANGKFYAAGDKPLVTIVIHDDAGNVIDHTKVTDANFSTASLLVYGPRARAVPVLTSIAKNVNSKLRASVSSSKAGPWDIDGKVFKIAINGSAPQEITIKKGTNTLVTAADVVGALNPVIKTLNGGAVASVSGSNVNIKTLTQGDAARIEIYNGDVTTAMGWKRPPNTVMEPDVTIPAVTIPGNDLRQLSDPLDYSDPMVTRSAAKVSYQLDDVGSLAAGTYHAYVYVLPKSGKITGLTAPAGLGFLEFQVGTTNVEKKVATNCSDCHSDTIFHLDPTAPIHPAPFNTDYCTACHDYSHVAPGDMFKNQGGTSLAGWSGFGAVPIARRIHGVHYAHYLEHSEEIYANATKDTFGDIIFPQDVRNCTKCHDNATTSGTWKENPSRVACMACHDSDSAKAHGKLMTFMPDPNDPYGPLAVESCEVCHGADAEFSPDKVHRIAKPYVPPYPRDAQE